MGMVSVGLGSSVMDVEVDVVARVIVASVVADVLVIDDFVLSFSFVDVVVDGSFILISVFFATSFILTVDGIPCICTLFTSSGSSPSMALVGSVDLDSVLADPAVLDEYPEAGSVVVVTDLIPLVAALVDAVLVVVQAL